MAAKTKIYSTATDWRSRIPYKRTRVRHGNFQYQLSKAYKTSKARTLVIWDETETHEQWHKIKRHKPDTTDEDSFAAFWINMSTKKEAMDVVRAVIDMKDEVPCAPMFKNTVKYDNIAIGKRMTCVAPGVFAFKHSKKEVFIGGVNAKHYADEGKPFSHGQHGDGRVLSYERYLQIKGKS